MHFNVDLNAMAKKYDQITLLKRKLPKHAFLIADTNVLQSWIQTYLHSYELDSSCYINLNFKYQRDILTARYWPQLLRVLNFFLR